MNRLKIVTSALVWLALFALPAQASNITDRYAWSETAGWINFRPPHENAGVTVHNDHLEGFAYAGNIGWIRLGGPSGGDSPDYYANTDRTDWGVNRDGHGNLSGYAWSEAAGWIRFDPPHKNAGVTLDPSTGKFDGYAWAQNIGWIHFSNAEPRYNVAYRTLEGKEHSADYNPQDLGISLSELLRVIQFYTLGTLHCDPDGEDGYGTGNGDRNCPPHDSDYNPQDWEIRLSELLRLVQLYNLPGYHPDPEGEDGFAAGPEN